LTKKYDFRPYVPEPTHPKIAPMRDRDAREHAEAARNNPRPQKILFEPWERMYAEPFRGVTTDGNVIPGLYSLAPNGAPTEAMINAVLALFGVITSEQKKALCYPVDAREWRRWNNTEMYLHEYGLRLDEIPDAVREAVLEVVRQSLSARGYDKTRDVMRLNHFLGELVGNTRIFGEYSFNFTLFGEPSSSEPWGWQLFGHHLALNCLVIGGQMVITPTFMGAEPNYGDVAPYDQIHLFEDEEHQGLELMRSLSKAQSREAILYHSTMGGDLPPERRHPADQLHLGGAYHDNRVVPYEGVSVSGFTKLQRRRLLDLIAAFVEPLPQGPMKARIEEVERHLDETRFCWIGGTEEDSTFYYRVQSPVVMAEFDQHSGVYLTNAEPAKFHIHTLVRTPNGNDYGADLLRLHYAHSHHDRRPGE
jgi:hypothetical protein